MTEKPKPCPRCGITVSDAVSYYFIPVENLRWHSKCYRAEHPELIQDQIEEKAQ